MILKVAAIFNIFLSGLAFVPIKLVTSLKMATILSKSKNVNKACLKAGLHVAVLQ